VIIDWAGSAKMDEALLQQMQQPLKSQL